MASSRSFPRSNVHPNFSASSDPSTKTWKALFVFDGSTAAAFNIRSRVKQGCVLAPTLFAIFFAVMLKHAFGSAAEGIYLWTRTDGKLFHLSRLRAKSQLRCLHDFLFADDAAVTAHSAEGLQQLMTRFSDACQDFWLITKLEENSGHGTGHWLSHSHQHQWPWTGCHPWLCLAGLNYLRHPLTWRRAQQAHQQGSYHHDQSDKESMEQQQADWAHKHSDLQSLRREHSPVWQRVLHIACPTRSKAQCFSHAQPPTHSGRTRFQTTLSWKEMDAPACSCWWNRDVWLGHVMRMDDRQIPKDLLYGELVHRKHPTGRPQLRFKDVCKRDLKPWISTRTTGKQQPSNSQPGDRLCRMVSPSSTRHSLSSMKKREWEERLKPMQTDQRQTSSVPSATGNVIPASDWPATPDAVPE